jgi:hypothetical protein
MLYSGLAPESPLQLVAMKHADLECGQRLDIREEGRPCLVGPELDESEEDITREQGLDDATPIVRSIRRQRDRGGVQDREGIVSTFGHFASDAGFPSLGGTETNPVPLDGETIQVVRWKPSLI